MFWKIQYSSASEQMFSQRKVVRRYYTPCVLLRHFICEPKNTYKWGNNCSWLFAETVNNYHFTRLSLELWKLWMEGSSSNRFLEQSEVASLHFNSNFIPILFKALIFALICVMSVTVKNEAWDLHHCIQAAPSTATRASLDSMVCTTS